MNRRDFVKGFLGVAAILATPIPPLRRKIESRLSVELWAEQFFKEYLAWNKYSAYLDTKPKIKHKMKKYHLGRYVYVFRGGESGDMETVTLETYEALEDHYWENQWLIGELEEFRANLMLKNQVVAEGVNVWPPFDGRILDDETSKV